MKSISHSGPKSLLQQPYLLSEDSTIRWEKKHFVGVSALYPGSTPPSF